MKEENYKVEKVKIIVDIMIDDGKNNIREYCIYLNKFSRLKKGRESIAELIDSKKFVIPVITEDTNEFLILNKNEIIYIREKEVTLIQNEKNIKLFIKDMELDVELIKTHKNARARVLDYFNTDTQFLQFVYNDSKIYVNKNKVYKISEKLIKNN